MTTSRLGPLVAGSVALAASAALIFSGSAAANAAPLPPTADLTYVALGDSYAAGFGILPSTELPVPGCDQAAENYPHQVAAALGMALTDVTCTGAVTANIIGTPQVTPTYFGGGTANPQSAVLSADTDVVTVSIGGNDAGFASIAEACLAFSATGPVLGPGATYGVPDFSQPDCQAAFAAATPTIDLAANVAGPVASNLANAYATIRTSAPHAKVFVVGYPSIFPDAANTPAGGCFETALPNGVTPPYATNSVPFTDIDVPFIHSIEVLLNEVIAEQAAAAGFTFIDNQPGSLAHSLCPQDAEPYINGVTIQSLTTEPLTAPGALHPNPAGVAYLTAQVAPVIAAAFPAVEPTTSPSPTSSPTPSVLPTTGPSLAESGGSSSTPLLGVGMLLASAAVVLLFATARRRTDTAS